MQTFFETVVRIGNGLTPPGLLYESAKMGKNLCEVSGKVGHAGSIPLKKLHHTFNLFEAWTEGVWILKHVAYFVPSWEKDKKSADSKIVKPEFLQDCEKISEGQYRLVPKLLGTIVATFVLDIAGTIRLLQKHQLIHKDYSCFTGLSKVLGNVEIYGKQPFAFASPGNIITFSYMFILLCFAYDDYYQSTTVTDTHKKRTCQLEVVNCISAFVIETMKFAESTAKYAPFISIPRRALSIVIQWRKPSGTSPTDRGD